MLSLKSLLHQMIKTSIVLLLFCAPFAAAAQAAQETKPDKIGYADVAYIMSQLPEMKAIESDLKSTQTQLRNQIQAKSDAVQKQYADFNANAKTMADTVRMRKQGELEKSVTDLEKMQQDAQLTLQNKQKLYMAPLYLKVNKAISEVAQENGFSIILTDRVSNFDFLLYQTPQLNVSDLVLKISKITFLWNVNKRAFWRQLAIKRPQFLFLKKVPA